MRKTEWRASRDAACVPTHACTSSCTMHARRVFARSACVRACGFAARACSSHRRVAEKGPAILTHHIRRSPCRVVSTSMIQRGHRLLLPAGLRAPLCLLFDAAAQREVRCMPALHVQPVRRSWGRAAERAAPRDDRNPHGQTRQQDAARPARRSHLTAPSFPPWQARTPGGKRENSTT